MQSLSNQLLGFRWKLTTIAATTLGVVVLSGFSAIGGGELAYGGTVHESRHSGSGIDWESMKTINQRDLEEEIALNEKKSLAQTSALPVAQQAYFYEVNFAGKSFAKYSADTSERFYVFNNNQQVIEIYEPVHNVISTAYTWVEGIGDPAAGDATTTQSMKDARRTYGIAADYNHLPRGTTLIVPGYGKFTVDDKCGRARRVGRGSSTALQDLGIPRDEWSKTRILIDLRIPNLSSSGVWRSNDKIQDIARKHGVQTGRTILRLVWAAE